MKGIITKGEPIIKNILEALREEGVKTSDIAKSIPNLSEKPFRAALKKAGYTFNNTSPKGWHYNGEGEEPLEKSIFDFVKRSDKRVKPTSQTVHLRTSTSANNSSPKIHLDFTDGEKEAIREMIQSWKKGKLNQEREGLHDRVKGIQKDNKDKKRGTIVISKKVMDRLDVFCDKEHEDKSDVLHLAIIDFLDRYEKEDL